VKRILVTGGAGFISSAFIRHLLRATPYEVVSLDALTYRNLRTCATFAPRAALVSFTATSATKRSRGRGRRRA
jgi:dTDP-D-glucose 4,6-dehydratase